MDRIKEARNRVFYSDGLGIGRNNPNALHTKKSSVYRITGMNQIKDIIECGYVRPKEGRVKGGHINEVFWSIGSDKLFYQNGRPVIEVLENKVKNGQIGAIHINDIEAIWMFDPEKNCYYNNLTNIKKAHLEHQKEQLLNNISLDNEKPKKR